MQIETAAPEKHFLIYVRGVGGAPSPQVWRDLPNAHSDYWNPKRAGIERIIGEPVEITPYASRLPLYMIERMHPPVAAG